jgi:hypothetical protein
MQLWARRQCLIPIILATQEAQIRRIMVQSQPGQIACETLSRKTHHKNRAGGVAQGESSEFKLKYCKKKISMWTSSAWITMKAWGWDQPGENVLNKESLEGTSGQTEGEECTTEGGERSRLMRKYMVHLWKVSSDLSSQGYILDIAPCMHSPSEGAFDTPA